MSKIKLNRHYCKSCGYCVAACKQQALFISQESNENGYWMVDVDESKCIGCGMCYTVCPDFVYNIAD